MLQLNNSTPFAGKMTFFPNEDAVDTLYVIVKATFNIGKDWTLAEEQLPPTDADIYWTEAGKSSIKYASDIHTGKLATDILMLGHACAPAQKEVNQLDVSLSVGKVSKSVRVFGDRQWQDGRITSPQSFKTMAMVYEKAYGGMHVVDGQVAAVEARNPVGRGFAGTRKIEEMNGVPLPNLEDPAQLIAQHTDQPAPACFSACAPNWTPRAGFAGTYDDAWQKSRAPYLPPDFDKRFLSMAPAALIYPGFIQGGEPVTITNVHPSGPLQFTLPRVGLAAHVTVAGAVEQPAFNLETLLIEPNQLRLSMVWRAVMACDKKTLKISEVKIGLAR